MHIISKISFVKPNCYASSAKCAGQSQGQLTHPNQCPKFHSCNAPICPLDQDWRERKHISGDKCCVYLLETAKTNAKTNFEGAGLGNMHEAIEVVKEEILSSSATINRAYTRASSTSSRLQPKLTKANKP